MMLDGVLPALIQGRQSPRAFAPEETLARAMPHLRALGITRIANITGLDRLGLPVVNVIRPNARSLTASQGKGLSLAAAKASGVMESIELHCAEQLPLPDELRTADQMARSHRMPDLGALPREKPTPFARDTPIFWTEGEELERNRSIWVPSELVHMNYVLPEEPGAGNFLLSSNGLASGNTREEAISHGLSELIERDASALFAADSSLLQDRRLDLASIDDSLGQALVAGLRELGMGVGIWDITSNVGVAAFRCEIMEEPRDGVALPRPASGEGCDPHRGIALCRAITEAAQARLGTISGVRDDLLPELYTKVEHRADLMTWWSRLVYSPGQWRFAAAPHRACADAAAEVAFLRERLDRAGLDSVIAVDLGAHGIDGLAVVRVVVPGLEPPPEAGCRPGRRLQAKLAVA